MVWWWRQKRRKASPRTGLAELRRVPVTPGGRPVEALRAPRRAPRRRRRLPRWLWRLTNGLALTAAGGVLLLVFAIGLMAPGLPPTAELAALKGTPSVSILDAQGRLIARRGAGQGKFVTLTELPPHLVAAVLAIEDRRFYGHLGVDPTAIMRALVANVEAGRVVQGGSTITQQLAKNLFLEPDRTLWRKGQEMLLALYLEMRFTKDEILAMYLNRAYFGAGAYGIDAAARRYFSKPASAVTLTEAAILAGLLKAPSRFSPSTNFTAAEVRGRLVLQAMEDAGFIDEAARRRAAATRPKLARAEGTPGLLYYTDWVMEQVPDFIGGLTTDLVVETTLDTGLQRVAEQTAEQFLSDPALARGASQIGLVALDDTGAVKVMVGGRDYLVQQFNHVTQARRQPGSAFKPFVYASALERGQTADSLVLDAPIYIDGWAPANFDDRYAMGEVSLATALAKSYNSAAVRLILAEGPARVARLAARLGIRGRLQRNASLALGTSEVTLLDLTGAYAVFGNGGLAVKPYAITRIRTAGGRVLYARGSEAPEPVLSPEVAGQMTRMLAETVLTGTGRAAQLDGREAAGKTGTSQGFRDAWFVGYVTGLTAGVWVGNDDGSPMDRVTGGSLPVQIWRGFMSRAIATVPPAPLRMPAPPPAMVAGADGAVADDPGPGPASGPPDDFDRILQSLTGDGGGDVSETERAAPALTGGRPHHKR